MRQDLGSGRVLNVADGPPDLRLEAARFRPCGPRGTMCGQHAILF